MIEFITGAISTTAETIYYDPDGDWEDDDTDQARKEKLNLDDGAADQELTKSILRAARTVEEYKKLAATEVPLCRHINITPTGLFLDTFRDGEDNSILRRYEDVGQFLRVSLCEEDVTMIRNNSNQDTKTLLMERYKPILIEGLFVAGQKFEFLGWSQSTLREHPVWFVCRWRDRDGSIVSASSILAGLGNFDRVGNIPGSSFPQRHLTTG